MIYCKRCLMTNTRRNLFINEEGICNSCVQYENKKEIDWNARWKELVCLCKKHKQIGSYDCVIAVSGGKDSHFIMNLFKEYLNMNPIGIMVDNFSWTETGRRNFNNLSERFGIDIITFTPNRKEMKKRVLEDFSNELWPEKYWDEILYKKPLELAQKLGVKLVIWGEDTNLTVGNTTKKETSNAKILLEQSNEFSDLDVIFTAYYVPWSTHDNILRAKLNGFKGLDDTKEWDRKGMVGLDSVQVDTIGYLVNNYCKFIKFGFSSMTEQYSILIREGVIKREDAIKLVNEHDWKLDPKMIDDFCKGINITEEYFWEVIDKFANRDILKKDKDGYWKLKEEIR